VQDGGKSGDPSPIRLSRQLCARRCIGLGGRGKTGIATTFINKNQSESILLDLKHLLKVRLPAPAAVSLTSRG
jgi:hypothetical protein